MNKCNAKILDVCCGGKMFYFDKNDPRVLFQDIREVETASIGDALAKYRRKRVPPSKVKEEIADVLIMLGQLMLMLPPTESSEVEDFIKYKLARLKNRLKDK